MGWRDWIGLGRSKAKVGKQEAESPVELLESSPTVLAATFKIMVGGYLEAIEKAATQTGIELNFDHQTSLFRQVCFFVDALWYRILLPNRILETQSIPSHAYEEYLNLVRQRAMEAIVSEESIPEEWRNWSTSASQEDLQRDLDLYMNGVVPQEWQSDFSVVLALTRAETDGSVLELAARLYLRVCQILGLIEKREPLIHLAWWSRIGTLTGEFAKAFQNMIPKLE